MSKTIPNNGGEIVVAADMVGSKIDGRYIVTDRRDNNRQLDPVNDLDDKIKIYKREVQGWFLDPAFSLLDSSNSFNNSLIVLMICMSYIEGVEQYKTGTPSHNKSFDFFKLSIKRLYPEETFGDTDIKQLYSDSRCGLFHDGMVKSGAVFSDTFNKALQFEEQQVKINPRKLLDDIQQDFDRYIDILQGGNDSILTRENFDRIFKIT